MLYAICVLIVRLWLWLCGLKISGREHIPTEGAALIIANHVSYGDPVLLAAAFPGHITFIAKEGFSKNSFTRVFFGALGAVFLKKEESDLSALRKSINLLKEGRTVAIFPEGRRNRDKIMSEFMPGAAFIAQKAQVPIIPVGILNSNDALRFWRRNLEVRIGVPLLLESKTKADQDYLAAVTAECQAAVAALVAQQPGQIPPADAMS